MSIFSLEELLLSAQHLERPTWGICRTMVNRKAQKSQRLSTARLAERLDLQNFEESADEFDVEDPNAFVDMLQSWEKNRAPIREDAELNSDKPLYLLRSLIYRSEIQNQLSFQGKTALDSRQTSALGEQYLSVAREIESLLTSKESSDSSGGQGRGSEQEEFEEDARSYEMHA